MGHGQGTRAASLCGFYNLAFAVLSPIKGARLSRDRGIRKTVYPACQHEGRADCGHGAVGLLAVLIAAAGASRGFASVLPSTQT